MTIFSHLANLLTGKRRFEGAAHGRRTAGMRPMGRVNPALAQDGRTLGERAAFFHRNSAYGAAASRALINSLVGDGIAVRSRHPNEAARKTLHDLFARWSARADADGVLDFAGLQALIARQLVECGEAFIRFRPRRPEDGLPVPLQLQLIPARAVPHDLTRDLPSGGKITCGVETDAIGRRVAFWVQPDSATAWQPVRVAAENMLHVFEPLEPGAVRGVPLAAPILLRAVEVDKLQDAVLVRSQVSALFTGFVTDATGDGAGFTDQGDAPLSLEPGSLRILPPGSDVRFTSPADPGSTYAPLLSAELHAIAAGLGVTYEQLTGDMSGTNYSSARVALLEHRRFIGRLQWTLLVPQLLRPVWQRFVGTAVLSGDLVAPDFTGDPAPWLAADFYPPGFDWVDPRKDAEAEILAITAGLKSRAQSVAERGFDVEQIDAEIAADTARAERLGILQTPIAAPAASPPDPSA